MSKGPFYANVKSISSSMSGHKILIVLSGTLSERIIELPKKFSIENLRVKDKICFYLSNPETKENCDKATSQHVVLLFKTDSNIFDDNRTPKICEWFYVYEGEKILELEKIKDGDGVTCTCGVISGGTTHNTVPGYCEFRANFRFVNAKQREEIAKLMQELADTVYVEGCKTEVEEFGFRPAMERVQRNLDLLDTVNKIFESNGLSAVTPFASKGGSDAAQVTTAGIPCLDNLGITGGSVHSPDEYAVKESLKESAKRLASIVYCI